MMSTTQKHPPARPPEHDEPIYWFALLERSLERGDAEAAAAAQRELRRLGVDVAYRLRRPRREVSHAD